MTVVSHCDVSAHPVSAKNLKRLPSEYLRCLYYDSCVYGPAVLEALIERVGVDRIVFGTDYPFGERDPVASIEKCPDLPPSGRGGVGTVVVFQDRE